MHPDLPGVLDNLTGLNRVLGDDDRALATAERRSRSARRPRRRAPGPRPRPVPHRRDPPPRGELPAALAAFERSLALPIGHDDTCRPAGSRRGLAKALRPPAAIPAGPGARRAGRSSACAAASGASPKIRRAEALRDELAAAAKNNPPG